MPDTTDTGDLRPRPQTSGHPRQPHANPKAAPEPSGRSGHPHPNPGCQSSRRAGIREAGVRDPTPQLRPAAGVDSQTPFLLANSGGQGETEPLGVWRPALFCAAPTKGSKDRRVTGIGRRPCTGWAGQLPSTPTRLLCPWPGRPQYKAGQGQEVGGGRERAQACRGPALPEANSDGREPCLTGVPCVPRPPPGDSTACGP